MLSLTQANKENEQFKVKLYTKLMENYNVFPAQIAFNAQSQYTLHDVCTCLDCKDMPVIIGSYAEGSMVQLALDSRHEAGFLPTYLGLTGKKIVMGVASDDRCYLFAIDGAKVWYACETRPGNNQFGDAVVLNLPQPVGSAEPVRIIARNVGGKLCVGVVVYDQSGYLLAYCGDFHSGLQLSFITQTRANYDTYDFMMRGDFIYAVSATGNTIRLVSVQDNSAKYYPLDTANQIEGLRWVRWVDNVGRIIVLARQDRNFAYGEVFLSDPAASMTIYGDLIEQCSFEAYSVISVDSATVHILFSGSRIYHAFLSNSKASMPIPIESGGGRAVFLETRLNRAEFYIADAGGNYIRQICQNSEGDYTGRSLKILRETDNDVLVSSCYSTELHLTDNNDAPLVNKTLILWAQDDVYIQCDSGTHRLGPNFSLTLTTDYRGVATFIQQVDDMVSTVLCIRIADYMPVDKVIYLRQHECASNRLEILTLEEFRDAKTANGEYFLPPIYRDSGKAKELLDTIQAILGMAPAISKEPDAVGAYYSEFPAEHDLDTVKPLESGFTYSRAADGSLSYSGITPEEFEKLVEKSIRSGDESIETTFGDLSRGIINDLVKMDSLSISGEKILIQFTITDDAYSFGKLFFNGVVSSLTQALETVGSLFSSIGAKFSDFFEAFGFIFNFDDIKRMKYACDYAFKKTLPYVKKRCSEYEGIFDKKLTEMQERCNEYLENLKNQFGGESIFSKGKRDCPEDTRVSQELSNNILIQKTMQYIGEAKVAIPQDVLGSLIRDLEDVYDELQNYGLQMSNSNEYQAIHTFLQTKYVSSAKLFEVSLSLLIDLLEALSNLAFNGLKSLSAGIFAATSAIIDAILTTFQGSLDIPFISQVYKKIFGYDLSPLDICSFLLGVAGTILCKFFEGKAPIASDSDLEAFKRGIDAALGAKGRVEKTSKDPLAHILKYITMATTIVSGLGEAVLDATAGAKSEDAGGASPHMEYSALFMLLIDVFSFVVSLLIMVIEGVDFWLAILIFDFLFLVIDWIVSVAQGKYITRIDWGLVLVCIEGFIRLVICLVCIAFMETWDLIAGLVQAVHEIVKPLLLLKDGRATMVVLVSDAVNLAIQVYANVQDLVTMNNEGEALFCV
jgi:hypothetical protein